MLSEVYYLLRSRVDGKYLVAKPDPNQVESTYLLMFREDFDALSYLNTHGADVAGRFAVESITGNQLKNLLQRWGFKGVGHCSRPHNPKC